MDQYLKKNKINISILITSINQRDITIDTACYYSKICSDVIWVDEEQPFLSDFEVKKLSKKGITYLAYKGEKKSTGYEKRLLASREAKYKYLVHSNHDERYTYNGLNACLLELKNDKMLAFCIGQAIAIRKNKYGLNYYTRSYVNLGDYRNLNVNISQRIYYHAEKYAPLAHYAVWKKQQYIDTTLKAINVHKLIPSSTMLNEVVFELAADISGNSKSISELFWIRNRINQPYSHGLNQRGISAFQLLERQLNELYRSLDNVDLEIVMKSLKKNFYFVDPGSIMSKRIILYKKLISLFKILWEYIHIRKRKKNLLSEEGLIYDLLIKHDIKFKKKDVANLFNSMGYTKFDN